MASTIDNNATDQTVRRASQHPPPEPPKLASGLFPCIACGGYHYLPKCIYVLPWSDWLSYQYEHMPSQIVQIAGAANVPKDELDHASLRERTQWLDRLSETHRPNYVGKSRMKADIMTNSTIASYWHETIWRSKLESGSAYRARKERLQLVAAGDSGSARTLSDAYESEDDSSQIELIKAIFAEHLPRTSTATLFKKDLNTVEHDEDGGWQLVDRPAKLSVRERREAWEDIGKLRDE